MDHKVERIFFNEETAWDDTEELCAEETDRSMIFGFHAYQLPERVYSKCGRHRTQEVTCAVVHYNGLHGSHILCAWVQVWQETCSLCCVGTSLARDVSHMLCGHKFGTRRVPCVVWAQVWHETCPMCCVGTSLARDVSVYVG